MQTSSPVSTRAGTANDEAQLTMFAQSNRLAGAVCCVMGIEVLVQSATVKQI